MALFVPNYPKKNLPPLHSFDVPFNSMPTQGLYPMDNPSMPKDLGMGMTLSSNPCAPISSALVMMTSLVFPESIPPEFYHVQTHALANATAGLQDEHSKTLLVDKGKKDDVGQLLLEQVMCPLEESVKTNLNSNDKVVKNLKQLEVDNSNSEGPFINSNDVKHYKREEDGKTNHKKKKSQKTSHSNPVP
ncbi:hypothetical protein Ancab_031846 [Ancistrocladus abbreviatus]